jgi:lipopolysaccharide transport system permease protein
LVRAIPRPAHVGAAGGEGGLMPEQTRTARPSEAFTTMAYPAGDANPPAHDLSDSPSEGPPLFETHITPKSGCPTLNLGELWKCRDLIGQLTLRNIRVRYKQTVLGVLWAIIQPVLTMVAFVYAYAPPSNGPFPNSVFVLSGLVPWFFFQTAVSTAANSVIGSEGLVTKVYFPRLAIPFASVAAALVDLAVSFLVLLALMLWYGILPGAGIVLLPLAAVLLTLAAVGIGTLIAALTVSYRDFRHAVTVLLWIWLLATPVIYLNQQSPAAESKSAAAANSDDRSNHQSSRTDGLSSVNSQRVTRGQWLARLNPMTVPIEFFRTATLSTPISAGRVLISFLVNGALCLVGLYYFRHVEDSFADVI